MKAIRNKNTRIEIILGKALFAQGYHFRKHDATIIGKPDFSLKKHKIAIFCDSEFFHGKNWEYQKHRISTNKEYWQNKIEANIRRDNEVNTALFKADWIVLRFWGNDIIKNLNLCVSTIENAIVNSRIKSK